MRKSSSTTRRCGSSRSIASNIQPGARPGTVLAAGGSWDPFRDGFLAPPRCRTGAIETRAVRWAADDPQHDLAEAVDRLRAGLAIGPGDARPLILRQLALELDALGRELEQALAAVALAGALRNEALPDELAQDAAQALLRDLQNAEQLRHRHFRMPPDELDDTMMGASKAVACKNGVGLGGEVAVGVE